MNVMNQNRMNIGNQSAHPNTLTIQIREGESHLTVTVPSTSLSQKQDPERLSPQSAFCMMMQLAMNLKFLFLVVMFLRIWVNIELRRHRFDWSMFVRRWRCSFSLGGDGWWLCWSMFARSFECCWTPLTFIQTFSSFKS